MTDVLGSDAFRQMLHYNIDKIHTELNTAATSNTKDWEQKRTVLSEKLNVIMNDVMEGVKSTKDIKNIAEFKKIKDKIKQLNKHIDLINVSIKKSKGLFSTFKKSKQNLNTINVQPLETAISDKEKKLERFIELTSRKNELDVEIPRLRAAFGKVSADVEMAKYMKVDKVDDDTPDPSVIDPEIREYTRLDKLLTDANREHAEIVQEITRLTNESNAEPEIISQKDKKPDFISAQLSRGDKAEAIFKKAQTDKARLSSDQLISLKNKISMNVFTKYSKVSKSISQLLIVREKEDKIISSYNNSLNNKEKNIGALTEIYDYILELKSPDDRINFIKALSIKKENYNIFAERLLEVLSKKKLSFNDHKALMHSIVGGNGFELATLIVKIRLREEISDFKPDLKNTAGFGDLLRNQSLADSLYKGVLYNYEAKIVELINARTEYGKKINDITKVEEIVDLTDYSKMIEDIVKEVCNEPSIKDLCSEHYNLLKQKLKDQNAYRSEEQIVKNVLSQIILRVAGPICDIANEAKPGPKGETAIEKQKRVQTQSKKLVGQTQTFDSRTAEWSNISQALINRANKPENSEIEIIVNRCKDYLDKKNENSDVLNNLANYIIGFQSFNDEQASTAIQVLLISLKDTLGEEKTGELIYKMLKHITMSPNDRTVDRSKITKMIECSIKGINRLEAKEDKLRTSAMEGIKKYFSEYVPTEGANKQPLEDLTKFILGLEDSKDRESFIKLLSQQIGNQDTKKLVTEMLTHLTEPFKVGNNEKIGSLIKVVVNGCSLTWEENGIQDYLLKYSTDQESSKDSFDFYYVLEKYLSEIPSLDEKKHFFQLLSKKHGVDEIGEVIYQLLTHITKSSTERNISESTITDIIEAAFSLGYKPNKLGVEDYILELLGLVTSEEIDEDFSITTVISKYLELLENTEEVTKLFKLYINKNNLSICFLYLILLSSKFDELQKENIIKKVLADSRDMQSLKKNITIMFKQLKENQMSEAKLLTKYVVEVYGLQFAKDVAIPILEEEIETLEESINNIENDSLAATMIKGLYNDQEDEIRRVLGNNLSEVDLTTELAKILGSKVELKYLFNTFYDKMIDLLPSEKYNETAVEKIIVNQLFKIIVTPLSEKNISFDVTNYSDAEWDGIKKYLFVEPDDMSLD